MNPLELSRRKQIQGGTQDARTSFYQNHAILDFNIVFQGEKEEDFYTKEFIKEETCHVFHATLSYTPDCFLKCGMENNQSVIKWGSKTVNTQLNKVLYSNICRGINVSETRLFHFESCQT